MVSMKSNVDSKQRVSDVATCKLNNLRRPWCAPGRKLQGACLHLPTTGHTGGRQDQASWWHEQPQLLRVCTCHRQSNICRRGEGADANADEMKLEMEKEEKTINMDSRSQPSKSVVAPLVRCPSCAASTAARRTCQIHRPALPACLACLPVLAITALSLHLPSASLPVSASVPSLPVPGRETVGYDVIRLRRPATGSDRVQMSGDRNGV